MTEFVHKPYDKIYVRDMIKLNLDDRIGMMSSLDAANAYWVVLRRSRPSAVRVPFHNSRGEP